MDLPPSDFLLSAMKHGQRVDAAAIRSATCNGTAFSAGVTIWAVT